MTKERFKYLMDKLMLIVKKLGQLVEEKENRIKELENEIDKRLDKIIETERKEKT
jgi:hypothetical protein|tara:strand:- start:183 stop:347 length:165 start_codon:yes stop_codon:yes gene_type:complete